MAAKLGLLNDLDAALRLSLRLFREGLVWSLALILAFAVFRAATFGASAYEVSTLLPLMAGIGVLAVYFGLSRHLYHSVGLGSDGAEGPLRQGFRLACAQALFGLALALVSFFVILFLIIFAGILVAVSGHDPTQGEASNAEASLAALHASGAIWLLWAVCIAAAGGLYWFVMRLITFAPATLDQGRLIIFRSWSSTKGQVSRLALLVFALQLVPLAMGIWAITALNSWSVAAGPTFPVALFSGAGMTLSLLPFVFLGHALAFRVYERCGAPHMSD